MPQPEVVKVAGRFDHCQLRSFFRLAPSIARTL
jgi:hypothetical protein